MTLGKRELTRTSQESVLCPGEVEGSGPGHDTLVVRLSQMLVKLNQGERLDPRELAGEFGVSIRTIQRDLNVRFAYLQRRAR
jgi:hypothetical protein